jgi:hypothetical protein
MPGNKYILRSSSVSGEHMTRYRRYFLLALGFLLLTTIFQTNFLRFADDRFFSDFQRDSESLVIGTIVADKYDINKKSGYLGRIRGNTPNTADHLLIAYDIYADGLNGGNVEFFPRKSQVGIQGVFFAWLHEAFNISRIDHLQLLSSAALSSCVIALFVLYRRIFDLRFSIIFLISLATSPWIIAFARNLYWTPFLWFLPAVFAALLYLENRISVKAILLLSIAVALFFKSLTGYEYLSSITIFACAVFVIGPYFDANKINPRPDLRMAFLVFVACIAGFIMALLVHAGLRGDTIAKGLADIFEEDVKRRTYGDPEQFPAQYRASLEASPLHVLKAYILDWRTPMVLWVSGKAFVLLVILSGFGLYLKRVTKDTTFKRDMVLLIFMFMAPASWFVLAKSHSFVHGHMNYVLWYLGFVPALIYVAVDSVTVLWTNFCAWYKNVALR